MKHLLLLIAVCLFSIALCNAQTCNLTQKDFSLRGLKLGMSIAEAEKQYEILNKKDADNGIRIGVIRFTTAYYYVHFLLGKLHAIYATYETKFRTTEDFTSQLSKSLNLPDAWQGEHIPSYSIGKLSNNSFSMDCQDFSLTARAGTDDSSFSVKRILPAAPFKP